MTHDLKDAWPIDFENEIPGSHDMDAVKWAKAFTERYPNMLSQIPGSYGVLGREQVEEIMIGWFANAIMAGYDSGRTESDSR